MGLIKKVKISPVKQMLEETIPAPTTIDYKTIQSQKDLVEWLKQVKTKLALTIQTNVKDKSCLEGLALALDQGLACYIPLTATTEQTVATDLFAAAEKKTNIKDLLSPLKPCLEDKTILKIGHNIKNDWHLLKKIFGPFDLTPLADIELISYNLDGTKHEHKLEELVQIHLNKTMSNNQAENYMSECADMILRLYLVLLNKIKQDKAFEIYQDIDAPLIPILYHMEDAGILVDQTNLKELDVRFTERLNKLTQDIYTEAGEEFNINSPAQLGVILYEKRGLSGGKRGANGHWITDV